MSTAIHLNSTQGDVKMFTPLRKGKFSSCDWLSKWLRLLLKCVSLWGRMQTVQKETKDGAVSSDLIETKLLSEKCTPCLWSHNSVLNEDKHTAGVPIFFLLNWNMHIACKCVSYGGIGKDFFPKITLILRVFEEGVEGGSLGRQQGRALSHHLLTPAPSQRAGQAGGQLRNPYILPTIVKEPSLFEEHLNWTTLKNALHKDLNADSFPMNLVVN